jgi:hypothetical protein
MKNGKAWTPEAIAKRAETRARNKLAKLNEQKLSVCWMDDDLQPMAMKLSPLERHDLAEKLEKRAEQMRGFSKKPIEKVKTAAANLTPKMKEAVIAYADRFGALYKTEDEKLNLGVSWILEISLSQIEAIANETQRHIKYRDAEGLDDSQLTEKRIGDALEKWKEKTLKSDDDDDD